jgi:hypothetical protein
MKEEVAEYKATFLDAPKGLEAASKCMCQFDTENNIIVMCSKVEKQVMKTKSSRKKPTKDS